MHIVKRLFLLSIFSVSLLLSGCTGTPDVQLARDVNRYPKTLLVGQWNGRFEYTDPQGVDQLKVSESRNDSRVLDRLRQSRRSRHIYRFKDDGSAEFFDPQADKWFKGEWEIAEIEGRCVMVDIRCKGIRFRKPVFFLGYNTITFRPGVNVPEHLKYGRVIYYRVRTWEKKEDKTA